MLADNILLVLDIRCQPTNLENVISLSEVEISGDESKRTLAP